jgi:O-antigen ligase
MRALAAKLEPWLFRGLLVALFIAPCQYGLEVAHKTYVSPADPLIWGLFGVLVVSRLFAGSPALRLPPVFGLVLVVAAAASAFVAQNRLAVVKELAQLVEYFLLVPCLVAGLVTSRDRVRTAAYTLLAAATVIVAFALGQYLLPGVADFAVRSTFGNRNVLGGFLALVLPLAFGILLWNRAWTVRLWAAFILAQGLVVLLAGASLLAVLLAFSTLAVLRGRHAFAFAAAAAVLVAGLLWPHLPRENGRALYESVRLYDDEGLVTKRYPEWQAAGAMLADNPWLGVGAGNYQTRVGGYFGIVPRRTGPTEPDTQNLYLVLGGSLGLPGLAAFLGLLLGGMTAAARALAHATDDPPLRGLAAGLLGGLLAFAVNAVWAPLLVRGVGVPLAALIALAALLGRLPHGTRAAGRGETAA